MRTIQTCCVALAFGLFACSDSSDPKGKETPVPDPFGLMEQLLSGIEESSSDLEAEAKRVVERGDYVGIIAFVRDNFTTIPGNIDRLGDTNDVLMGSRGILRTGMGTPRDKAELLFNMLTEAGFAPERRLGNMPSTQEFWDRILTPVTPVFDPLWSDDLVQQSVTALGGGVVPGRVDPDGTEATALGDAIDAELDGGLLLDSFAIGASPRLPIIAFEAEGETRFGNVFDTDVVPGEAGATGNPFAGGTADEFAEAEVSLRVVTSGDPDEAIEVASHTWSVQDLVGRQVMVQFFPAVEPEELLGLPIDMVREYVPAIALRGHDLTQSQVEEETHIGDIVTLDGDVFELSETGELSYRDRVIDIGGTASGSDVVDLELDVSGSAFRTVELRLAALNGEGSPVPGLSAGAFVVAEDGIEQSVTLLQNVAGAPRVLFMLDHSLSMPADYDVASLATLVRSIAGDIQATDAASEFRVHIIGGSAYDHAWTTDLDALEQAAQSQGGSASNLWRAASDGSRLNPTIVIAISDGQATDEATPEYLANIERLGPVLFVDVVDSQSDAVAELTALTGGEVFVPTQVADVGPQAVSFIEAGLTGGYILQYQAPLVGNATRNVVVSMRDGQAVSAAGSYDVPATPNLSTILRAEVVITIGEQSVTRVVAGDPIPPELVTQDYVERIRRELLAVNIIGFETGDPTPSALAKDLLRNKLNAAPLIAALSNSDPSVGENALLQGAWSVPPALLAALRMPPGVGLSAPVFPTGVRAALYRHTVSTDVVTETIDILPFGGYASMASDSAQRLRDVLKTTSRAAVIESALFDTATLSSLSGESLVAVAPRTDLSEIYPSLTDEDLIAQWERALEGYNTYWKVVPESPDTVAFWSIDPATGSMLGILADGSGGGATENQEQALAYLNMLDFAAGGVGANWQLGFWISLSKAILTQAIRATKAISTLGVEPPPPGDIYDAVSDVACDMLKDAVFGAMGTPGERIDFADSTVELYTGDGIPCTP